jgi:hypothetical protein
MRLQGPACQDRLGLPALVRPGAALNLLAIPIQEPGLPELRPVDLDEVTHAHNY